MRTTVTLSPEADGVVRRLVAERGLTPEEALDAAVVGGARAATAEPHRTPAFDIGLARVPLDRALALAGDLEDEELLRRREAGR